MDNGFLALALHLDGPTLDKIPRIMECARKLLQDRLGRVEHAKFDPRGALAPAAFEAARATVEGLIAHEDPAMLVFAGRHWIKQRCPVDLTDAEADRARHLIAFVRQDLCASAQCKIPSAWLSNGFGFWAKVFPGLAVPILEAVAAAYNAAGIHCRVRGAAHLICPPKGGAELGSHIDGAAAPALRACIGRFVDSGGTTNEEFAAWNGVQCLTHIEGGREGSGATCTLAPITPARDAILLDTIAASEGAKEKAFMADEHHGPKFYTPSKEVVAAYLARLRRIRAGEGNSRIEKLIREDGLPLALEWCAMVPAEDGPFTLAFPRGYFHLKQANTHGGRVSLSGGVRFGSDAPETSVEAESKKRKIEYIASQSRMAADPAAIELVRAEKMPFSGGATHRCPGLAAALMAPGCPFAELVYTPEEAARLRELAEGA